MTTKQQTTVTLEFKRFTAKGKALMNVPDETPDVSGGLYLTPEAYAQRGEPKTMEITF